MSSALSSARALERGHQVDQSFRGAIVGGATCPNGQGLRYILWLLFSLCLGVPNFGGKKKNEKNVGVSCLPFVFSICKFIFPVLFKNLVKLVVQDYFLALVSYECECACRPTAPPPFSSHNRFLFLVCLHF